MLRKITILALSLVATSVFATPISKNAALSAAKVFLQERGIDADLRESQGARAHSKANNAENPYYYIFNTNNKGFVIVSGDDCLKPILGYSDEGNFDPENIPDGLQMLLDAYEDAIIEINSDIQKGIIDPNAQKPKKTMSVSRNPVKPFLNVAYGQSSPYYIKNPKIGSSYTNCSCTTVVIGEIMAYYQYPDVLPALEGYTTETAGLNVEALPEHVMDWSSVLPYYNGIAATTAQKNEIANLMRWIGQHGKCDFNEGASSSLDTSVYYTLYDFGYKVGGFTSLERKELSEWEDFLYQDLLHQRPVAVFATNIRVGGARHAFIFDGYDQDGLYHVDWGWEGCCRGYYSFDFLSPYKNVSSYTYMKNVSMAYRIAPKNQSIETTSTGASECLELTNLSLSSGKISTKVRNELGRAASFKYGLGLYDDKFNLVKVICEDSTDFAKDQNKTVTWNNYNFDKVADGKYRVYPISKLKVGDNIWHFDKVASTNAYCIANVANGEGKYTLVKSIVYNSFTRDKSLKMVRGAAREYTLNVTNNTMDFSQKRVYLFQDSITPVQFARLMIPANSTADVKFLYAPQANGKHVLMLTTDTTFTNIIFTDTVNVTSSVTYSLKLDTVIIDAYDKKNSILYGNTLRFRFKLTNDGTVDYDDYVRPLLRKTTWYDTRKFLAHIPVNESQWFEMETNDMIWNHAYGLTINVKSKSSDDPNILPNTLYSKTFTPKPGIRVWNSEGAMHAQAPKTGTFTMPEDALAVDFTAPGMASPANIVPNSNPNTFYYVIAPYESLEGLNQIVNGEADLIVLHDSIPCYLPMDFKADSICYTRTFKKGFMGKRSQNNWTTITLPFTVNKVFNTVDNVYVDWYKPGDTKDKNFWVREFYSSEGYDTYFKDAAAMKANVPYIITVPGDYMGPDTCLVDKPLVFSATNADVVSGKSVSDTYNYNFVGTYRPQTAEGNYVYMLDEENRGNNFVYMMNEEAQVYPFRAYFNSGAKPLEDSNILYIRSYIDIDTPTSIDDIKENNNMIVRSANHTFDGVYTISGTKIRSLGDGTSVRDAISDLPSGIYIVNGKKYVK